MTEMDEGFVTTVFDKLRLYERARGAQRGRAAVDGDLMIQDMIPYLDSKLTYFRKST